ncbi:MAG: hypothetical protein ACFB0G_19620 [Leptolyngbyaceae cyanobacterium]
MSVESVNSQSRHLARLSLRQIAFATVYKTLSAEETCISSG